MAKTLWGTTSDRNAYVADMNWMLIAIMIMQISMRGNLI